jgi:hypothetical protein
MQLSVRTSPGIRVAGIVLIVLVGLLNFHVPHFFLEATTRLDAAALGLALGLSVTVVGALTAAIGIGRSERWGWRLGAVVVVVVFLLFISQETVGLPGLPKNWLEPSRIVALVVEAAFLGLAIPRLSSAATSNAGA